MKQRPVCYQCQCFLMKSSQSTFKVKGQPPYCRAARDNTNGYLIKGNKASFHCKWVIKTGSNNIQTCSVKTVKSGWCWWIHNGEEYWHRFRLHTTSLHCWCHDNLSQEISKISTCWVDISHIQGQTPFFVYLTLSICIDTFLLNSPSNTYNKMKQYF